MRWLLPLFLLVGLSNQAPAARPQPFEVTQLPIDRPIRSALIVPSGWFVLQEDQAALPFIPLPNGGYAVTPGEAAAAGAVAGVAAVLISEGVALIRRRNDEKRLAIIESGLGRQEWGSRLEQEVRNTLSPDGLGTGFEYSPEVPRQRIGTRWFDQPGRARATIHGHVAFTPNLRALRIFLSLKLEDRRVVRERQMRLEQKRHPLRELTVEYLIPLEDSRGLRQKERAQRWSQQDPVAFAAQVEAGIVEVVRLANQHWKVEERDFEGDRRTFRADSGFTARGRVIENGGERALLADRHDGLHSVPTAMLTRGLFQ